MVPGGARWWLGASEGQSRPGEVALQPPGGPVGEAGAEDEGVLEEGQEEHTQAPQQPHLGMEDGGWRWKGARPLGQ